MNETDIDAFIARWGGGINCGGSTTTSLPRLDTRGLNPRNRAGAFRWKIAESLRPTGANAYPCFFVSLPHKAAA